MGIPLYQTRKKHVRSTVLRKIFGHKKIVKEEW